jgi:uncharacterized coiled-coil protein SlyX
VSEIKPQLVVQAQELREAFQSGNDERMMEILEQDEMIRDLSDALAAGTERTLSFAAPQIAALAERVGYLEEQGG